MFPFAGTTGTPKMVPWSNHRIWLWRRMVDMAASSPRVDAPDLCDQVCLNAFSIWLVRAPA